MADSGRRRVGAGPAGAGVRSPPPYQQQQQQQMKGLAPPPMGGGVASRYARDRNARNAGTGGGQPKTPPVNSKMGIKSGMTVEDLKRLTQQRMQKTTTPSGAESLTQRPATPTPAPAPAPTPSLNMAAVNAAPAPAPIVPKAGMSVQELKQLTSLRLASQNVPLHQSEITGLVSKAVLSNAAKSHYRESLRGSLTPSTTPKRTPMAGPNTPVRGNAAMSSSSSMHDDYMGGRHSMPSRPMGIPNMRASLDSRPTHDFSENQMRYSYPGPDEFEFDDSNSSDETDTYARPSLDIGEETKYGYDEQYNSLQFPEDSFPPPPPLDDNGGFVSTALPSWSPPPTRAKKLDGAAAPVSFYSQQPTYFNQQSKEESSRDQNAVIAPPPGLTRRPSMTVPWQVAEAVLNTPQTTTGRKTIMSPTSSREKQPEPISSNMFGLPTRGYFSRNESSSLKNPAAEAAAELGALSLSRQRSGAAPIGPNSTAPSMLGTSPPGNGSAGARRGSFGNAAEFFKFRRRSKSRLELARDLSGSYPSSEAAGGFPNYGATNGTMPGIDESRDNFSVIARADTNSVVSNSESVPSPGFERDDANTNDEYEDSEGGGSFVSFYNATGAGRNRDGASALSSLSIPPPPPPPPMTDDEDEGSTTSSSMGLPMMSPNGVRLRKVAEMARRGSLSSEDKTRAKDEIIQSSLGIGASNAARILTAKPANGAAVPQGDRPPVSPSVPGPPPGFQLLGSTPPRDTPKTTAAKTIPAGIVRSTSTGIAARSPPKPSTLMSPTSSTSSRKALSPRGAPDALSSVEERLAAAAQRVADSLGTGDTAAFRKAMEELDGARTDAAKMMSG